MSLGTRAVLAVALFVAYVVFTIALVAAFITAGVLLGWGAVHFAGTGPEQSGMGAIGFALAAAAAFMAAYVIVKSLRPRRAHFEAPGPELVERDHPRLFSELRRVAAAMNVPMPDSVYATWRFNAGVMQHGRRRILSLGLPLVATFTVAELRAVFAHELGHFHGGDVKLGPWIHRTQGMLVRTIVELAIQEAHFGRRKDPEYYVYAIARIPFLPFMRMFLRVSRAISRAQELAADVHSARVAGGAAAASALTKSEQLAPLASVYAAMYLRENVDAGALPPASSGFHTFVTHAPRTARPEPPDPFDSHPPLAERLAAVDAASKRAPATDDALASSLIDDPDALAHHTFETLVGKTLTKIDWPEALERRIERWRKTATAVGEVLDDVAIDEIDPGQPALRRLVRAMTNRDVPPDALRPIATDLLGAAIMVLLLDVGFTAENELGKPFIARRGDVAIAPFEEVGDLLAGKIDLDTWRARWTERGLGDHVLSAESDDDDDDDGDEIEDDAATV